MVVLWEKKPCWYQRRMARLLWDDRRAIVSQITILFKKAVHKDILACTAHKTLKETIAVKGHSCQLGTRNSGHNLYKLSKSGQKKIGKCCLSEFGVNNMKPPKSQYNTVPLECGGIIDKSGATAWCYHASMDQNLGGMFQAPYWIYGWFEGGSKRSSSLH